MKFGLWIPTLSGIALVAHLSATSATAQEFDVDGDDLKSIELMTEDLANRLLELSVSLRRGDAGAFAAYTMPTVVGTVVPKTPEGRGEETVWTQKFTWAWSEEDRSMDRDVFIGAWAEFMERFAVLEDVRFKVKNSTMDVPGQKAHGKLKFFFLGRNREGEREWIKGTASFGAQIQGVPEEPEPLWRLDHFHLKTLWSMTAKGDFFSEVGLPAGLDREDPPFFEQDAPGYLWRGAATADVNQDGLLDIFVVGYRKNDLYLNQGDGTFKDGARDALLDRFVERAVQPLFLDVDHDGDLDLFVSCDGPQLLYENRLVPDGTLMFLDASENLGQARTAVGFSATTGDVNGDGWSDIYVCSYNRYGYVLPNDWALATNGTRNLLFLGKPGGKFEEQAEAWGIADSRWTYAAQFVDIDEDGDQDLCLANDYGVKGLYINEGQKFKDCAEERGVLDPGNGMGVAFGDIDNDGDLDLHFTNMSSTAGNRILARIIPDATIEKSVLKKLAAGNSIYENLGGGRFKDVTGTKASGLSGGWAWGGGFVDFDNDGWIDVYSPNGFVSGKSMADT